MIKRVHITNFKSLEDVAVDLDPITVLIGRSGSGKTNFVEALRFLREYLAARNDNAARQVHRGWDRILPGTGRRPMTVSFALWFDAPGLAEDFHYELKFQQQQEHAPPQFAEEKLGLGNRVLFHQRQRQWVHPPPLVAPPPAGGLALGALTGVQEATVAYMLLTKGIGCYAFPDQVLTAPNPAQTGEVSGFADHGDNFLQAFIAVHDNLSTWQQVRDMTAALRRLIPSLKSIDLEQPGRQRITVSHQVGERLHVFDLEQESEGFRRLLACLIALYQWPSKQTLIFDEPEKGIYPAGLAILADEFKGYASKGRGQILLTTHSPEFLDQFDSTQIRVVEMHGYATRIGPVAPEQLDALRDHFMKPRDLLTVDEARLAGSLMEVG